MEASDGTLLGSGFVCGDIGCPPLDGMKQQCGFTSSNRNRKTSASINCDCSEAKAAWSGSKTNPPWAVHRSSLRLCRRSLTEILTPNSSKSWVWADSSLPRPSCDSGSTDQPASRLTPARSARSTTRRARAGCSAETANH